MSYFSEFQYFEFFLLLLIIVICYVYYQNKTRKYQLQIQKLQRDGDLRYKDLSNLLPQLVVELDQNGQFIFINNAGLELIDYTKSDIRNGLTIFDIIHPEDKISFKEEFLYLLEGGINRGQEFRMVKKNGEVYFAVLFLKAIETGEYSQSCLRGFIIDISDRKKLERKVLGAILNTEDKERRRFSEDLHDGLGPLLSTIKLYINQMTSSKVTIEEEKEMLSYTNELLDEAISTTRQIANNILPGSIVDNGLVDAISSFCHRVQQAGSFQISFNHNLLQRFEIALEINLYRIIIELINNSIKHANAMCINIKLNFDDHVLHLVYSDDGVGFDVNKISKGLGINNINNRAKSLNGIHSFSSELKQGMTFDLKVELLEN